MLLVYVVLLPTLLAHVAHRPADETYEKILQMPCPIVLPSHILVLFVCHVIYATQTQVCAN